MLVLVVAGFVVVMSLMEMEMPLARVSWPALLLGAGSYVAFTYLVTWWNASRDLARLMRPGPARPTRGPALLAMATQIYMVLALAALMLAGWGAWIEESLHLAGVPLAAKALAVAPFVLALLAYWWAIYPLEQALRLRRIEQAAMSGELAMPAWTRRQHLSFNLRHHLLFVAAPAGAIILVVDVIHLLEDAIGPAVSAAAAITAGGLLFLLAPALVVSIWRTRPLPAGELRGRLEQTCRRLGLRYRRILLWDTGGVIVNAGVMGVVRPLRYVLLSDALLARLDEDSVEAIFAHEAGHVLYHHIPYMIAFTVGLLMLCGAVADVAAGALGLDYTGARLLALVIAAGTWGWLFGPLSRRFERQADVFGAVGASGGGELTALGTGIFGNSLMQVARFNGIPPTRRNYRHGSIQRRVNYLVELLASTAGREKLDRQIRLIKLGILVLLAGGIVATLATYTEPVLGQ